MASISPPSISNRLARVAGRDLPVGRVVEAAIRRRGAPVQLRSQPSDEDYALIDPTLAVASVGDELANVQIAPGTGYAGMTPAQRTAYLRWLEAPNRPGPRGFQDLYLAQLEVRLFEGGTAAEDAALVLHAMQAQPSWQSISGVARATLLGCWLSQDGPGLRKWLTHSNISPDLLALGLGLQALLNTPLDAAELAKLSAVWHLPRLSANESILKVHLASLTTTLGGDPLTVALERLDDGAKEPRPWRGNHRELRLALPQPLLRRPLEALLADLEAVSAESSASEPSVDPAEEVEDVTGGDAEGTIILEFGESRSEYFDYVLHLAQQLDGYGQIMDENRRLIYRVRFHKSKLRKFWRIWEYVQNWSSTRIYVDGEEIERWKVWPYSQYLR